MQRAKLDSLTGLRGIAALLVAAMHSLNAWPHYSITGALTGLGGLAVPFFFCLSGFVMQWTWSQRPTTALQFLIRRLARIYPTAMLGLVISLLAYRLLGSPLAGYVGGQHSVVMSVFLIQSWAFNVPEIRQSWDGVSWSLSCEFFFYLMSPLVLPLVSRLNLRGALIPLFVVVISYIFTASFGMKHWGTGFLVFAPIARLPEYLCGTFLARVVLERPVRISKLGPLVALFASVVAPLGIAESIFNADLVSLDLIALPGFLVLIFVSAHADLDRRNSGGVFSVPPLITLGKISFSFYMMHALILGVVDWISTYFPKSHLSLTVGEAWRFAFLIVAICVAALVHRFFENPLHDLILRCASKLLKSKPTAVPESGAASS
jgi:peptidoglycan/LPS O-acetylase OafA/YrhL